MLKDKQQQSLFYQIDLNEESNKSETGNKNGSASTGRNKLSLARIFTLIEQNKAALCIETFSLSQTTLEQIFIAFANAQSQATQP
jgi:hypothetical protein